MDNRLSVEPLVAQGGFNWVFLVELLVCGILALFFLFYFNRLFATVIAYSIRAWTWHKYRAYIDISALQISLLGGRIFFKSIRYHAHNITVFVYEGHVTWRYWLRLVQDAEIFEDAGRNGKNRASSIVDDGNSSSNEKAKSRSRSVGKEESAGGKPKKELPCRISVKVGGVEAFVYNRSPMYDFVMEQTKKKAKAPPSSSGSDGKAGAHVSSSSNDSNEKTNSFAKAAQRTGTHETVGMSSVAPTASHDTADVANLPAFLRMFPVRIECKKAAAAVGNENTTSVIAAKLEKAAGTIDAGHAGPLDWYKLLFSFDLENINVTMKPNRDFKSLQLEAARRIIREREQEKPLPKSFDFKFIRNARKRWHAFTGMLIRSKSVNGSLRTASMAPSVDGSAALQDQLPGQTQWHGLARYLDDKELNEHDEWRDIEYAKASTLADIEKLHMRFYFDMPGTVPDIVLDQDSSEYADDINGSKPPDYGLDFAVHGGVVTYGPWADRQRLNLQQIFFPASYVDAVPTPPLKLGETRNWSLFKIFISIEKDVTLRIPSREPSKDEKWQGRAEKNKPTGGIENEDVKRKGKHGRRHRHHRRRKGKPGGTGVDARPYGWLDVTVKTDSTISYIMDMFPKTSGYRNTLDVDVKNTEITSSVNHGLLWRTGAVSVQADLSQPITWNTPRKWPFDIRIYDMELFILRDHLFLIIDLVNDWSSGAPSSFYTFVPYIYSLRMLFHNFIMYLNVNDANIVNDAAELDKNDFLTLEGILDSTLDISMEEYRPVRNMITFDVLAKDMRMRMLSPARSTFNAFLKDKVVAELPKLTLKGSYSGHIEERVGLTDTLRFDIIGTGMWIKAYGFLVRQLINIKENYFGDYLHFKTLEEFQGADEDLAVANLKTASLPKPTSINELDVILCIIAEDATVMFPTNIYTADEYVSAQLAVANLDLRILSYYLDMGLQLSPLTFLSGSSASGDDSSFDSASNTQMFVKHLDLDGHRAFGLPPNEPAYANQWNINVGAITGEFSSSFIHDLAMGAKAFIFGFQDRENALPVPSPSIFDDVTFVQVRTDIVRLWFHVGKEAILFSTDPIEVVTNDLAGDTFSQRVSVLAPKVTFACVDGRSASRHRVREIIPGADRTTVRTYAFFQTGAAVNVLIRKLHFEEERRKQQKHLREHDRRTGRVPFLLRRNERVSQMDDDENGFDPAAMPYPLLPLPLDRAGVESRRPASIKSVQSFVSGKEVRSKPSTSSLSASIKAGMLSTHPNIQKFQREDSNLTPSSRSMRSSSRGSSADSNRQSYALSTDQQRAQFGLPPSTVAFSSSFSEPYFPLDMVEPDESSVPAFDSVSATDDSGSDRSSLSEMIEDPGADHDVAQTSVMIKLEPGIRVYVEPRVTVTAAKLLRKVLPKEPDEVMDSYQIDALGAVATEQQQHHGTNQTLEIQIGLPAAKLRVLNPTPKDQPDDRLDIAIRSVETLVRKKQIPLAKTSSEVLAVHASVDNIGVTLGYPTSASPNTAVEATVDDVLVWVAVAANRSVHAALGDTVLSVSAEQAAYLTDLALRLIPLINELTEKVQKSLVTNQKRLWLLVRTLTENSEDMADPIFLARMTYILRAFPDHFRNQDSWKILVRFRHILQTLPPKVIDDLKTNLKNASSVCPSEPPAQGFENSIQWRNWDVPNVHQTIAFQMLVKEAKDPLHIPDERPLTLTVRSEYLRIALESGDQSNEIVLEETSLGMDSTPPTMPTGLMLMDENTRTKTVVQMHTSSVSISANWSVFGIVERVLPLQGRIQELSSQAAQNGQPSASQRFENTLTRHVFQLVASTDNGSINLQSINLRHISRADGLKISVTGTTHAGELEGQEYGPCATAIINADAAITELHGRSRCLFQTRLTSPSIYVDYVQPMSSTKIPPSTTIAIGYKDLRISLLEQVPGLLRVADSVVLDEVSRVIRLVESTKTASFTDTAKAPELAKIPESAKAPQQVTPHAPVKVHFALLAGELILEVSLLQALQYQLRGTAASIRLAPSLTHDKSWGIDFDIGRQLHCFVNSSANERSEQSILDVPPIIGHVGLGLLRQATSLSVAATMERVDVDATAIQGVVAVLNQPEVQNVISAITAGVQEVQTHVEKIKPESSATDTLQATTGRQVAFDVRFALLGIRVAAVTPLGLKSSSTAEVEFGIGPFHAIASNRSTFAESKSLLPEVRAQVRDIGAKLQVKENGEIRPCGNATFGLDLHFKSRMKGGQLARELRVQSQALEVNAFPDTASTAVDVINHLQDRIRDLDLSKEMEYLRRLSDNRRGTVIQRISGKETSNHEGEVSFSAVDLLSLTTTVELRAIRIAWLVDKMYAATASSRTADLVLSLELIEFTTRGGHEARLAIEDMQLQLAKKNAALKKRSLNSALMPEVTFSVGYWSTGKNRHLAFKAAGKPLEIRLESRFMYPVNAVQRSIEAAIEKFKTATATWQSTPTASGAPRTALFDTKRLASLLVEADFAGAQFYVQGSGLRDHNLTALAVASQQQHGAQHGRYGQFAAEGARMQTTLKAPGIAMKVEYNAHSDVRQPTVNGEVRIDASSNMLLPNVVPLLLEVSNSVTEVMQKQDEADKEKAPFPVEVKPVQKFFEDDSIATADPTTFFGKTKVDLGLRVCRQEFGLTCQPIARIDAKAALDDFYITMNTINSDEHGHFFALSAMVTKLSAEVKHVYSREPTFTYDMDSIVFSVLNSKHLSGTSGISAILKINPTRTMINGKQLQDLLLFREIWLPPEIRASQGPTSPAPAQTPSSRPDDYFAQRYRSLAAAAAFPWNATVSIAELAVDLDLGQSIGKSSFTITNLWASQTKSSNSEQNLCIGMDEMAMNSTGRMSGFIRLNKLGVRTSIKFPQDSEAHQRTPLIQASAGFQRLLAKAAFDYQAFAFGDIEGFDFLMYNVHQAHHGARDRLVAVLDCEKAYVFCTSTSPAQAVGLVQAFNRLIQEKQAAYMQSLTDIEKHVRRESTVVPTRFGPKIPDSPVIERSRINMGISLHTDVVLTMGTISFGVFPSTFFDAQILKLEANNIQARFAVGLERDKIHSGLGMTLGQLQVALASVRRVTAVPKALDIAVDDVVSSAVNARGGTILRVPKVVASMQTWQAPESNNVDYIFKSLFDGKIDVGWNLSRIDFIKNMWMAHSRSLASRLGKALPESAVKITAGPANESERGKDGSKSEAKEKITAEVNLPQSKYEYHALEPAIIETPQLRDLGDATPPLEWIGLNRDRLPNVTHQIIIVSLLEVAREVEDAYEKILGSS
jgi:hypothetical protein